MKTYTLPSISGQTLRCTSSEPENVRALMLISHGMAEYVERYTPFMEAMAEHGILTCGHSHIGHGSAAAETETLGYLPWKDGKRTLISDILAHAAYLRKTFPGRPLILFGHSMGSFIARLALAQDQNRFFDAAVICGTGGKNPAAGPGLLLQHLISLFRGSHYISAGMNQIIFGANNNRIEAPKTAFDWLSRDAAQVSAYMEDPFCGFPFTISALGVLTALSRDANRTKTFESTEKTLPLCLISGAEDPIGAYGAGVQAVRDAYVAAGLEKVTMRLYPGARHELLNEINRDEVIGNILTFCRRSVSL